MSRGMTPVWLPIRSVMHTMDIGDGSVWHSAAFLLWDLAGTVRSLPWAKGGKRQHHVMYKWVYICTGVYGPNTVDTPHDRIGNGAGDSHGNNAGAHKSPGGAHLKCCKFSRKQRRGPQEPTPEPTSNAVNSQENNSGAHKSPHRSPPQMV